MAHHLAYLQHYWKDVLTPKEVNPEWGTITGYFHKQVKVGDTIWVVITGGPDHPNEWRLIQKVHVKRLYFDSDEKQTHPYRAEPNCKESKIFDPQDQDDMTQCLWQLQFTTGNTITAMGRRIGQCLQRIRQLSEADADLLEKYAESLKVVC